MVNTLEYREMHDSKLEMEKSFNVWVKMRSCVGVIVTCVDVIVTERISSGKHSIDAMKKANKSDKMVEHQRTMIQLYIKSSEVHCCQIWNKNFDIELIEGVSDELLN